MRTLFIFLLFLSSCAFAQIPVNQWTYIEVDSTRQKWGDWAEPDWLRYFGLDYADANRDGYLDIIAGRYFYLNPGGDMTGEWKRSDLGFNADGMLFADVDNDEYQDVIAEALPNVYWFEALDLDGTRWSAVKIAELPATGHVNGQGYLKAQIVNGGKEEIILAVHEGIYYAEIPKNAVTEDWKFIRAAATDSDEGFSVTDLNGDGHNDIVAGDRKEGKGEATVLKVFLHPGDASADWNSITLGETENAIDRMKTADFDGDGNIDIAIAEERYPGKEPDANLYWFKNPGSFDGNWERHIVVTQYSMNNLDVADIDKDGDADMVTNEHKGTEHKTTLFLNDGKGNFTAEVIDTGKESHLGTQFTDLDNDGDLDLVSAAWDNYKYLHVWRNDAIEEKYAWRHVSSANDELPMPSAGDQQTALLVADLNKDNLPEIVVTERTGTPAVTALYNTPGGQYQKVVIDDGPMRIEAGSAYADVDGDGDTDIIFGGESGSNQVWWFENPYPDKEGWKRHLIKDSGARKHHDIMAADVDMDGQTEIVFWNQGRSASALFLAEIPENPRKHKGEWPLTVIYDYSGDSEMQPTVGLYGYPGYPMVNEHEGLAVADIDLDGNLDIVGGGHWFKYENGAYVPNVIDAGYQFTRTAVGQLIEGGRPEVILTLGDGDGPMYMYYWHEWEGWKGSEKGTGTWARVLLDDHIHFGHSLQIVDFNLDGMNDIFVGEMSFDGEKSNSGLFMYKGLGNGKFKKMIVDMNIGAHESRMADMDNDGDLDIVNKPYTWMAPRVDIYYNELK